MLKRAEKRSVDEEFTKLCINRLGNLHGYKETMDAVKDGKVNYFDEITKFR
jgi:hypothetical protein